jgi:cyclohexyl-isocyanide hydratase
MTEPIRIAMLIFPDMTNLDFAGPYEIFAKLPDCDVKVVWKDRAPVRTDGGLLLLPTHALADCPQADLLFVPGGSGQIALMNDLAVVDWLAQVGRDARYVTSVCTGALLLGAAGLLDGYKATTHWMSMDLLSMFGAEPTPQRVVIDRNRITGGGVTAGIDFGFALAAILHGEELAQRYQLTLEYDPQPPFDTGSPARAPRKIVEQALARAAPMLARRRDACERAAARLRRS